MNFIVLLLFFSGTTAFLHSRRDILKATMPPTLLLSDNKENKGEIEMLHLPQENTFNQKLKIQFYSGITQESCLQLNNALLSMNEKANIMRLNYPEIQFPIHLHIQSPGGSLMDVYYLCDVIQSLDNPVYTYVDGYAASAATLLSVCGKKRFMSKNSFMLIHQLSSGMTGKYTEMKTEISNLDIFMSQLESIYLQNTNIEINELKLLLSSDLWLNSTLCKHYGLVDTIL